MFWERPPNFGGGFLFLGGGVKVDVRFNAFTHFLEDCVGLGERQVCSSIAGGELDFWMINVGEFGSWLLTWVAYETKICNW